jgi:hypothetical protein
MATNHNEPATTKANTPAEMLTRTISRGTRRGTTREPTMGVAATMAFKVEEGEEGEGEELMGSEPFGDGLMGRVAVIFWSGAAEFQRDAPLLLPIRRHRLDRIHLLTIPERHLDPERAIR